MSSGAAAGLAQVSKPGASLIFSADEGELTRWITAQRPPRASSLDFAKPHGVFIEESEPDVNLNPLTSGVILLTNKECPWRCLMCDLWKNTTTKSVPPGAIPRQVEHALSRLNPLPQQVKLYNSGSFFDPGAIPPGDYGEIAGLLQFAKNVVVESHPRLVGDRAQAFRESLPGSLEVAMGLETIHPRVLPLLNKKFDLTHFSRAAQFLVNHQISVRAFVLVKPPFLNEEEGIEWAVKSASFAIECGASAVSLIPTRPGNGAMERLAESGEFSPPRLNSLEKAQEVMLKIRKTARIFADIWDLRQFSTCDGCFEARRQRMLEMNRSQEILLAIECGECLAQGAP